MSNENMTGFGLDEPNTNAYYSPNSRVFTLPHKSLSPRLCSKLHRRLESIAVLNYRIIVSIPGTKQTIINIKVSQIIS